RRLHFRDPIDELASVGFVANRIDDHLAGSEPSSPNHRCARQAGFPRRNTTPHVDAGIGWPPFVGMKLLTNGGVQTVARDQRVGPVFGSTLPGARVVERRYDAGFILLESGATPPEPYPVGTQAFDDRIVEHEMTHCTLNRILRVCVACISSQRFALDQLTKAVEKGRLASEHADIRQSRLESEQPELTRCMGKDIDTHAEGTKVGRCFEYTRCDAGALQRKGQR